jgi:hypothetical protein
VKRAAEFIRTQRGLFPAAMRANSATAAAVLAVKTHELFLDAAHAPGVGESMAHAVQRVVDAVNAFDQAGS